MPNAIQVLIAVLGVALTALATQGITILSGMRTDIKDLITRLDNEANARHELTQRVTVLETKHEAASCQFLRRAGE